MALIDISVPLNADTPLWPGSTPLRIERVQDFDRGDPHAVSEFGLGAHSGTHLDAPQHFLPDGALLEDIPLDVLIGPCRVLDVSATVEDGIVGVGALRDVGLDRVDGDVPERVLLRTRAEGFWDQSRGFDTSFAGLDLPAAELLIEHGVRLLGLDVPSVEPYDSPGNPVHQRLMAEGIVLLETLRLSHVPAGDYELICLPPRLTGVEAAPCRAVLRVP